MIWKCAVSFLALGLLSGADAPKKDESAKDLDKYQGTWILISIVNNGDVVDPKTLEGRKLIVKRDVGVLIEGEKFYALSTQKLAAEKNPKEIDIEVIVGPDKGKTSKGIYSLEGDDLTVCYIYPGEGRPADFKAEKGSGCVLIKFKREKE